MTDSRVSRDGLKVLQNSTTGSTTSGASRVGLKVAQRNSATPTGAGAVGLKVIQQNPQTPIGASRVALKVMVRRNLVSIYENGSRQPLQLLGLWDGAKIQPINNITIV